MSILKTQFSRAKRMISSNDLSNRPFKTSASASGRLFSHAWGDTSKGVRVKITRKIDTNCYLTCLHLTLKQKLGKKIPRFIGNRWVYRATSFGQFTKNIHKAMKTWALSIRQKFRFEISKIPRAQWNATFRLHRPDPSHRAFGYCSCKQNSKELYWGQQFCQMERDISVRPTEMTRPVKVDHLIRWSQIFRSDRTEMVLSVWFLTKNSGILSWVESAQGYDFKEDI